MLPNSLVPPTLKSVSMPTCMQSQNNLQATILLLFVNKSNDIMYYTVVGIVIASVILYLVHVCFITVIPTGW